MLTTEKPHFVDHPSTTEKWLRSETAGEPLYRLRAESGTTEATFSVELVGVERGLAAQERETAANRTGEEARFRLPPLGMGQSLEFAYRFTGDRVTCALRGRVQAEVEADAMASARAMWENLEIWLDAQDRYRFAPVVKAGSSNGLNDERWRATVAPAGLRLPSEEGRAIGYMAADKPVETAVVIVRCPTTTPVPECLDKMVRMLAAYPRRQVEVVISVGPYALDGCGQRLVEAALRTAGGSGAFRYGSGAEVRDLALLNAVTAGLERWCRSPSGFRLTCEVRSDRPVPEAFLAALGNESPPSFYAEPVVPDEDSELLDLRSIVHGRDLLPPLLPPGRTLAESGMPFCYSSVPHDLTNDGIVLGRAGHGRFNRTVHLSEVDRERHCYLLGATGTGKSTLLYNMLMQDIKTGAGVCLIDPHGDLYHQVMEALPLHRAKDLVAIDMCDFERAVGINFLECEGPFRQQRMSFITNEMMKIFNSLYNMREAGGPMFEQYMRHALLLVMDNEHAGGTLMDIPWLFEDAAYRNFLLDRCRNPLTTNFWRTQAAKAGGEASLANIAPYITCKLNQFTGNALLRPVIGQAKSTIDFRQCMDENRILLVNLSKGILGDLDSQLLGMLIAGKIFGAATQRVIGSGSNRVPFHLYIDEAHNFTTDTLIQMLAESRKFGLHMVLANQNLAQLDSTDPKSSVMQAVLGNVGTLLSFRLGAPDAEKLEMYFKPQIKARDLADLPNYQVAARLLVNSRPARPFVFETMNADPCVHDAAGQVEKEKIVWQMRERYTRSIHEMEEALIKRREQYSDAHSVVVNKSRTPD